MLKYYCDICKNEFHPGTSLNLEIPVPKENQPRLRGARYIIDVTGGVTGITDGHEARIHCGVHICNACLIKAFQLYLKEKEKAEKCQNE